MARLLRAILSIYGAMDIFGLARCIGDAILRIRSYTVTAAPMRESRDFFAETVSESEQRSNCEWPLGVKTKVG